MSFKYFLVNISTLYTVEDLCFIGLCSHKLTL